MEGLFWLMLRSQKKERCLPFKKKSTIVNSIVHFADFLFAFTKFSFLFSGALSMLMFCDRYNFDQKKETEPKISTKEQQIKISNVKQPKHYRF